MHNYTYIIAKTIVYIHLARDEKCSKPKPKPCTRWQKLETNQDAWYYDAAKNSCLKYTKDCFMHRHAFNDIQAWTSYSECLQACAGKDIILKLYVKSSHCGRVG